MNKKKKIYTGEIDQVIAKKIILNIKHLQDGRYTLTVKNNNQILKEVNFLKTTLKR